LLASKEEIEIDMSGKKKMIMEFEVKASANLLYPYLSTPSGLSEWFCNDVDVRGEEYKFKWDGEERVAKLIRKTANKNIKFHWVDSDSDEYFEFELEKDELTGDVAVVITDFSPIGEEKETEMLWESQIQGLMQSLGLA
jgi:uncharacterized protein YndB with AHSA1/START domain